MKPHVSIGFIYALTITLLAFIYRSGTPLYVIALINGLTGFTLGVKRYRFIIVLFILSVWAVFLNALLVSNTGEPVLVIGSFVIREGVIEALINISSRLLAIAGVALLFISIYTPLEIIRGLETELRLPKIIVFPLAYGLRLLPVIRRDYEEIKLARRQRNYRTIPLTPWDIASYLQPLINLSYERALWTGIAIELRGFQYRKPRRIRVKLNLMDYILILLLSIQLIIPFTGF